MGKLAGKTKDKVTGDNSDGWASPETQTYWTEHNVTLHRQFKTKEESLACFDWRNDQYYNYIEMMPVAGFDGKVILDYGCGPGHDLVGFGEFSEPKKLIGMDISSSSLADATSRLQIHGIRADMVQLSTDTESLPLEDNSVDHIHSSGVLHHTPNPVNILRELNRILRPGGSMNVMIYNYDSLWTHLYVAYQRSIVEGLYPELDLRGQFAKSTDGEDCPISNCYKPEEWISLCHQADFDAEYTGAGISMHEMSLMSLRFAAIQDELLPAESRKFLVGLTFGEDGYPLHAGKYAGVNAYFCLVKCRHAPEKSYFYEFFQKFKSS
jgi:SAM-dependent methyltransferase